MADLTATIELRARTATMRNSYLSVWSWIVCLVSGENVLKRRPNGGDVILLRSLRVALTFWMLFIATRHLLDPTRVFAFSASALREEMAATLTTFGAMLGVVYAALYARFASQWSYLAGVYNQIKAAESRLSTTEASGSRVIAEWKAGFLEDAENLHLATKQSVASIIAAWANEGDVRTAYGMHTPGGELRLRSLLEKVAEVQRRHEKELVASSNQGSDASPAPQKAATESP